MDFTPDYSGIHFENAISLLGISNVASMHGNSKIPAYVAIVTKNALNTSLQLFRCELILLITNTSFGCTTGIRADYP